jgi:hypothetical protein
VFPAVDVFEQHLNEEAGLPRVGHPDNGTAVTSSRVIACITETVTHVKHLQTALKDISGTRAAFSRLKAQLASGALSNSAHIMSNKQPDETHQCTVATAPANNTLSIPCLCS